VLEALAEAHREQVRRSLEELEEAERERKAALRQADVARRFS
jgi:hypothetical protein